jgi:hypothetical protein
VVTDAAGMVLAARVDWSEVAGLLTTDTGSALLRSWERKAGR